ncbi:MAG: serine--tRNA ligase [Patescibacteria group bacterium]|nr:serine--tRNA ligase [Patescibacteria group bacterium]
MLDIKFIRENPDKVIKALATRGYKADIKSILKIDDKRREFLHKIEQAKAEQNNVSKEIGKMSSKDKKAALARMKKVKDSVRSEEEKLEKVESELAVKLVDLPNIPLEDVPVGKDESFNVVLRGDEPPKALGFEPKDHIALGESLDLIDVERAAKVSGSRFCYLKNQAVMLQFALARYAVDTAAEQGFMPMIPPVLIKHEAMRAMGYLEHGGDEETYQFEEDNLILVGTSEQSGLPYHMNETLDEKELPKRYICYSTCFRREAGSYGKDVRGILRVHQFDKLEMLSVTAPEKSRAEHELIISIQEKLVKGLGLPYRVVALCTGDLGAPSAKTIDIETWMPSQKRFRETHSSSNCTDFQARRLNLRCKTKSGNVFCHTLNGTAFAMGRILIAILENFQQKDGSINIPEVLHKYLDFTKIPFGK